MEKKEWIQYPSVAKFLKLYNRGRITTTTLNSYVKSVAQFCEMLGYNEPEACLKFIVSKEDKENIEKTLKELREALSGDDTDKIKEKTDELSKVLQKASTAIYQQAAQQAQQQQQQTTKEEKDESWSGHPSDDDKTIDADYKVKDKKKTKDKDKKD